MLSLSLTFRGRRFAFMLAVGNRCLTLADSVFCVTLILFVDEIQGFAQVVFRFGAPPAPAQHGVSDDVLAKFVPNSILHTPYERHETRGSRSEHRYVNAARPWGEHVQA